MLLTFKPLSAVQQIDSVQVLKAKEPSECCPVSFEKWQPCSFISATHTAAVLSAAVRPAKLRVCLIRKLREELHRGEVKGATEKD